jgi:hypothetical protein
VATKPINRGKHLAGQVMLAATVFEGGVCMPPRIALVELMRVRDTTIVANEIGLSADELAEFKRVYTLVVTPEGR